MQTAYSMRSVQHAPGFTVTSQEYNLIVSRLLSRNNNLGGLTAEGAAPGDCRKCGLHPNTSHVHPVTAGCSRDLPSQVMWRSGRRPPAAQPIQQKSQGADCNPARDSGMKHRAAVGTDDRSSSDSDDRRRVRRRHARRHAACSVGASFCSSDISCVGRHADGIHPAPEVLARHHSRHPGQRVPGGAPPHLCRGRLRRRSLRSRSCAGGGRGPLGPGVGSTPRFCGRIRGAELLQTSFVNALSKFFLITIIFPKRKGALLPRLDASGIQLIGSCRLAASTWWLASLLSSAPMNGLRGRCSRPCSCCSLSQAGGGALHAVTLHALGFFPEGY